MLYNGKSLFLKNLVHLTEIIEGIHRVNDKASVSLDYPNVYLLINGKELTVIDTGWPGNAAKTVEYIQKIGHQPTDVKTIILTHFHMDHRGSAKELKDLTKAKVAVHAEDADYVSGIKPISKPQNILLPDPSFFDKLEPVQVDVILREGDKISGLTVIHMPGHTSGSIMLLEEKRKILFTGDILLYDGKKVSSAPLSFNSDSNKVREAIAKAATLNFDVMLPGHGVPLKLKASEEIKKFSESLRQK